MDENTIQLALARLVDTEGHGENKKEKWTEGVAEVVHLFYQDVAM